MNPLSQIRQIDYTVIFVRDMEAMRHFYGMVMEFPLQRTLSDKWIEYRIGANTLALAARGGLFNDQPSPQGSAVAAVGVPHRTGPDGAMRVRA
jgi:catechol 2,3-dioxygenase-like lactoylglutathione lyase family enzyme